MSGSPPGRGRGGGEGEEGAAASSSSSSSRPRASRGRGRRRTGDPSSSSSSRPRSAEAVWPEHFVESVVAEVSIDAARHAGRLAAARAAVTVFQVCSTWRAVSASEYLWETLCRRIWSRRRLSSPSWHEEYVRLHRTAINFLVGRSAHSRILPAHLVPAAPARHSCRRLAVSDSYLAAGFLDGSVRMFDLPAGRLVTTYHPDPHRARLGRYSQAVAGIFILDDEPHPRLTFASQDGDVQVAVLGGAASAPLRRAFEGNLVVDGTLVDFTGDARWWVGLFAGVPGHSWHVWNAATEQLTFVGGSFMDTDAVYGWHMLTELPRSEIARVRMVEPGVAVGCSPWSMEIVDLDSADPAGILNDVALPRPLPMVVGSVDACEGRVLTVDRRSGAIVSEVPFFEEICRFSTYRTVDGRGEGSSNLLACMNWGYVVVFTPGGVRVWDAMTGEQLHLFREQIGMASAAVASERYVAAWGINNGLHLWDFGRV